MSAHRKSKREIMKCCDCSGDLFKLVASRVKKQSSVSLVAECVKCGKQDALLTSTYSGVKS